MSCQIVYNSEGKIARVNNPQGKESRIFNQLSKLPHLTVEGALDIYKNLFSKSVGVYYNITGEKYANSFPKIKEKLNQAKKMQAEGVSMNDIEKETGWYLDIKGWRYLDKEALKNFKIKLDEIETEKEYKLSEIVDYPEFFEAYPSANEISVVYSKPTLQGVPVGYSAFYSARDRRIQILEEINPRGEYGYISEEENQSSNNTNTSIRNDRPFRSTLLHELQHLVQREEGFPVGGSERTILFQIEDITGITPPIRPTVPYTQKVMAYVNENKNKLSKENLTFLNDSIETLKQSSFSNIEPLMKYYKKIFGEVEARLVEEIYKNLDNLEGETYSELKANFLAKENIKEDELVVVEPNLEFLSDDGNYYNSYKEALLNSNGGDIEVGVTLDEGFKSLVSISSNTNKNTRVGLINYFIKSNLVSDQAIVEDGVTYIKAEGTDGVKQIVNEDFIKNEVPVKVYQDGRVEFIEKSTREKSEAEKALISALPKPTSGSEAVLSEDALKSRLLDFLKEIGVEVTSIDNYIKKYKVKNGVEPTADALADISRQVVAFREGSLDSALLTEEVAHFIVEGWNPTEIADLLRNIHRTATYQEFASQYREIYTRENPSMSEQEIEELVRKEILGKELSNALVKRFSPQTETEANFFQNLYNLLLKFFDKISLQGNYRQQLDLLSEKVEDMLLTKDVNAYIDTTQFKSKKFRMYNVSPTTETQAQRALVKALLEQEKYLRSVGMGSSSTVQKLESQIKENLERTTVQELSSLAERQINYVNEALKQADIKGNMLSNEEAMVYHNLVNAIRPALASLSASLSKTPSMKSEVEKMRALTSRITNDIEGVFRNTENQILDKVVDRLVSRYNLEGTDVDGIPVRDYLKNGIQTANKDTSALYSYFGQITHASDPILNILGSVIGDMYTESSHSYIQRMKNFQKDLRDLGFKEQDLVKLMQEDGYITSEWDFKEFEDFRKYAKVSAYKQNLSRIIIDLEQRQAKGEDVNQELSEHKSFEGLSDEKILETFENIPMISSQEIRDVVIREAQMIVNTGSETMLSEEYLKEQEDKFLRLGISDKTRAKLRGFSEMRAQVKRQTKMSKNGVPIFTTQNKYDLEFINIERRKASSIRDIDGIPKRGLVISDRQFPGSVQYSETEWVGLGSNFNMLSEQEQTDAQIAFDMTKLRRDFIDNNTATSNGKLDKNTNSKFFADLYDMENDPEVTREDIISWFNLNTQVGFSSDFFKNNEKEDLFAEFEEDENVSEIIERYKQNIQRRRAIVNQFRDSNNSVNTLASVMTESTKQEVKSISEDIDNDLSKIFLYIKGKNKNKAEQLEEEVRVAETGANEAYFGALSDENLTTTQEKLDFTLKHVTASNRRRIQEYMLAVEAGRVPDRLIPIVDRFGDNPEGVLAYAQSKLLPYYSSFAPIALQDFYRGVRETDKPISELIDKLNESPDVRISVSYDYMDATTNDILNPNRDKDFRGGVAQPSLTKKPTVLGRQFDFNNKNWSNIKGTKLEELQKLYIDFQYETLKSYESTHLNVYDAPNVSNQRFEQIQELVSGKDRKGTLKDIIQDMTKFRADELLQGEEVEGQSLFNQGVRVIPRYFLNKLEDVNTKSKDLFYTSAMMAQQAELYKARKQAYSEISAIEEAMNNRTNVGGKAVQSSNSYRMLKSYVNHALYGIQEQQVLRVNLPIVGVRDMTKSIKTLHRYVRKLSLAFTPIVPLTSMITAHTQLLSERMLGQYVDSDSANRAMREFSKEGFKSMKEGMEMFSKERYSVIGEYFNIFDLDNRFQNSKYNVWTRMIGKTAYGLHTAGNYTPLSQAMVSVLYGHRVDGNKVVDFNEFKKISGLDEKEAKAQWKTKKPIYDYIQTKDGVMTYSDEMYTDLGLTKEEFRNIELGLVAKVKKIVERIDGQIKTEERTYAQRNFMLQFLTTHKGWLSIAVSNRFKGSHINLQTGMREEGSYLALGNYLNEVFNRTGVDGRLVNHISEVWKSADEARRTGIKRTAYELATLGVVYAIGLLFSSMSDDDEEDVVKQLLAYISSRTVNETVSSQFGLVGELYKSVSDPVVGLSSLSNSLSIWNAFDTTEIARGRYRGLTEQQRYFIRATPGVKAFYDLSSAENLKAQHDSYRFFNKENEVYNIYTYLLNKDDIDEILSEQE